MENKIENTPESYADLLKARGDVPIAALRKVHEQMVACLCWWTRWTQHSNYHLPRPKPRPLSLMRCGRSIPASKINPTMKCWRILM